MNRIVFGIYIAFVAVLAMSPGGCKEEAPAAKKPSKPSAQPRASRATTPVADAPGHAVAMGRRPPAKKITVAGLRLKVPGSWREQTPRSPMRKAQFELPGDQGPAELVIFHFGSGEGGARDANVRRWVGQFRNPDDSAAEPKWESATVSQRSLEVTTVKVRGTYAPNAMGPAMPAPEPRPDFALFGIIIEGGPEGTIFAKITGPLATIVDYINELDEFGLSARLAQ